MEAQVRLTISICFIFIRTIISMFIVHQSIITKIKPYSDASQWVVSADSAQMARWLFHLSLVTFQYSWANLKSCFYTFLLFCSWMSVFQAASPVDGKLTGRQVAFSINQVKEISMQRLSCNWQFLLFTAHCVQCSAQCSAFIWAEWKRYLCKDYLSCNKQFKLLIRPASFSWTLVYQTLFWQRWALNNKHRHRRNVTSHHSFSLLWLF